MTDRQVPAAIRSAVARRAPQRPALHGPASAGDVCFAWDVDGEKHLVFVKSVDAMFATVWAAHTMPEMAGPSDVLLIPEVTGISYPVVVQTDVIGVVWQRQLGQRLAESTALVANQLRAVSDGELPGDGVRLAGFYDRRWHHKQSEADTLGALCGEATGAAIDYYSEMGA